MKKSLLLVLGVLASSVAMAEGNVVEGRLGYSFGEGKLTENVTKKVVLTGEYRREVMPNLEVGLGLDVKRADEVVTKKVNNNYAEITRTGLPVYGVVQYNFKNDSDVVPYIKGRLGVVVGRDYQVKEVAPVATTGTPTVPVSNAEDVTVQPEPTTNQPAAPSTTPAAGDTTTNQPAAPSTTPAAGTVANVKKEFKGNALYAGIGVGVNYKNFVVDLSYNYTTGRKLSDADLNNVQTDEVRKEVKELVKSGTGVVTLSVGYTLGF